jgi:hypothetical protein
MFEIFLISSRNKKKKMGRKKKEHSLSYTRSCIYADKNELEKSHLLI